MKTNILILLCIFSFVVTQVDAKVIKVSKKWGVLRMVVHDKTPYLILRRRCTKNSQDLLELVSVDVNNIHVPEHGVCTDFIVDPTVKIVSTTDHNGCVYLAGNNVKGYTVAKFCYDGSYQEKFLMKDIKSTPVLMKYIGNKLYLVHNFQRPANKRIGFGRVMKIDFNKDKLVIRDFKFAARIIKKGVKVRGWRLEDVCLQDDKPYVVGFAYQVEEEAGAVCVPDRWRHYLLHTYKGVWLRDAGYTYNIMDWVRGLIMYGKKALFVWNKDQTISLGLLKGNRLKTTKASFEFRDSERGLGELKWGGYLNNRDFVLIEKDAERLWDCSIQQDYKGLKCKSVDIGHSIGAWTNPVQQNSQRFIGISLEKDSYAYLIVF